jgi:hypothetical protein
MSPNEPVCCDHLGNGRKLQFRNPGFFQVGSKSAPNLSGERGVLFWIVEMIRPDIGDRIKQVRQVMPTELKTLLVQGVRRKIGLLKL